MKLMRYDQDTVITGVVFGLRLFKNHDGSFETQYGFYRNGRDCWEYAFELDRNGEPRWCKCSGHPDFIMPIIDELDPQDVLEIAEGM